MAICVDDMLKPAKVGRISDRWSHLFTDHPEDPEQIEELHRFAQRLGLKRQWFQEHHWLPHYDVTTGKRGRALQLGAVAVKYPDKAREIAQRRYADRAQYLPDVG